MLGAFFVWGYDMSFFRLAGVRSDSRGLKIDLAGGPAGGSAGRAKNRAGGRLWSEAT